MMKVILVGYSKTGTKTMACAFRMLGLNTYDTVENLYYAHKGWMNIFRGEATVEDIQQTFAGVDALTDSPVYHYWEQLHEAFPEAKIVLTLRDEDAWYKSFKNQIEKVNRSFLVWFMFTFSSLFWIRTSYHRQLFSFFGYPTFFPRLHVNFLHEKILREHFRYHNANVLQKAPKDKLLVYNVSEGWEPLCEFLGVNIPQEPFPHKNKRGDMLVKMNRNDEIAVTFFKSALPPFAMFTGVSSYILYKVLTSAVWKTFCQTAIDVVTGVWDSIV